MIKFDINRMPDHTTSWFRELRSSLLGESNEIHYFVLEKIRHNKHVLFFGAAHATRLSQPKMFDDIQKYIVMLSKLEWKKIIIGESDSPLWEMHDWDGEAAFAKKFGYSVWIDFVCPEPTKSQAVWYLQWLWYADKDIFCTYCMQWYHQRIRRSHDVDTEASSLYLRWIISLLSSLWLEYSYDDFVAYFQDLEHIPLDNFTQEMCRKYISPHWTLHISNHILSNLTHLRDKMCLQAIQDYINSDYHIFVLYGADHVVKRKPVIDDAMW